jgi:hypothetical protein
MKPEEDLIVEQETTQLFDTRESDEPIAESRV